MAATVQISRISATKTVTPKTVQIARISATSNHSYVPKTVQISSIVVTAPGDDPGPRTVQISSIQAQVLSTGPARVQISRISASTANSNVVMPAPRTVNSGATVTLTATAPAGSIFEWSQTGGTSVAYTATGGTLQYTAPALKSDETQSFQARAQIAGVWTSWAVVNITVRRHRYWVKRSGSVVPVDKKPKSVTPPSPTVVGNTSNIPCYGDSMVAGFGIGVPASWPTKLQENLPGGRTTQNFGVSSQTAQEIAMRQGGMSINLTFPGNTIPATGAVTVTTPDTIVWGAVAWTVTGVVGGVAGTLSHPAGTAGTNTATLTWTRSGSGSTVSLGGTSSFAGSAGDRDKVQIFLAGRNDYGIGGVDSVIRNRVINANKAMVDHLTTPYFIVLSNLTLTTETSGTRGYNNVVSVNASLASLYGDRFFDVRRYLIDHGLQDLSITPTTADLAAIAADTMPPSLMYDNIHWNAAAADLVADKIYERLIQLHYLPLNPQEPPTPGLFFKMPDMSSSPRKVLAHYFGPYPRSINNSATLASDTYTTVFNNPYSTAIYGTQPANIFGGAFRDRPQWRPQITGDYKYADARWDIQQAQAAGIDGFFCDLLGLSGSNYDNYETLKRAAHDMNTGFVVVPMIDANGATASAAISTAAAYIASFAGKNGSWYLPDGRFVVSVFKLEGKTVQYWTDLFAALQTNHGLTVAFIGVAVNTNTLASYSAVNYGESSWGYGADPAVVNAAQNLAPAARGRGKKWMAPVVPQDVRPQNSLFDEALNTGTLRATWEKAINQDADYVQMVSWSDYSETAMAPSVANGWVNLDLSSWYIARWKTGSYPTILTDALYLSHRGQTLDSNITALGGQTKTMQHWSRGSMSAVRNNVEVLSFLTAPAVVTVTVGTATYTYNAPAGQYVTSFPAVPAAAGTVKAVAVRASATVASITSPVAIRTSSVADDKQYFRFSSIRGTSGQYDVLTTY